VNENRQLLRKDVKRDVVSGSEMSEKKKQQSRCSFHLLQYWLIRPIILLISILSFIFRPNLPEPDPVRKEGKQQQQDEVVSLIRSLRPLLFRLLLVLYIRLSLLSFHSRIRIHSRTQQQEQHHRCIRQTLNGKNKMNDPLKLSRSIREGNGHTTD
jgi:hypothetical protein